MSAANIMMWMLYSLCIGAVVSVAAIAAADAQKAASRPVRWIWFGAIAGIVALTLAAPMRRSTGSSGIALPLAKTVTDATPDVSRAGTMSVWYAAARAAVEIPLREAMTSVQSMVDRAPSLLHKSVAAIWLLGSLTVLGVFGVSYVRIRRRVARWPLQNIGTAQARIAPRAGPAVVGLAPPEIIIPAWLLERSVEEQQLVVTHEQEHVRAGDPWLLIGACAALVLFPWNPALWFAFARLQLAVELDCDRRVLRRGVPAAKYGSLLIEISSLRVTLPSAMPAFSHNSSYLERRLLAMTSRVSRYAKSRRVAGAGVALVALIAACESKLPTSADIEKADGATATKQVAEAGLVIADKVKYTVDGKPATAAEAKAISAEKLAGVQIEKAKVGQDSTEIRLLTRLATDSSNGWKIKLDGANGISDSAMKVRFKRRAEAAVRNDGKPETKFDGLVVVDGKISDAGILKTLSPQVIQSVEVLKGSAAAVKYTDPRAANGVIEITLKKQ